MGEDLGLAAKVKATLATVWVDSPDAAPAMGEGLGKSGLKEGLMWTNFERTRGAVAEGFFGCDGSDEAADEIFALETGSTAVSINVKAADTGEAAADEEDCVFGIWTDETSMTRLELFLF